MLLIGEYTEFPAWLPADPGSGIALFNSTEGAEPFANTVLSVHNPSFLCADGYGGFYALDEGPQGLLTHFIPDGKSFYFAEQVAFEAQGSCHLCVSPEHKIYISNYDSGTLTVVSDNNGHLEVIQTLYFHGGGPVNPGKALLTFTLADYRPTDGNYLPQILEATVYIGLTFKRTGV